MAISFAESRPIYSSMYLSIHRNETSFFGGACVCLSMDGTCAFFLFSVLLVSVVTLLDPPRIREQCLYILAVGGWIQGFVHVSDTLLTEVLT